jgi:hypothetical protein
MALHRNPLAAYYRDRGAAPHPADRDLRIGSLVELLGDLFEVLADAGLLDMEAFGIAPDREQVRRARRDGRGRGNRCGATATSVSHQRTHRPASRITFAGLARLAGDVAVHVADFERLTLQNHLGRFPKALT